jgi:hypothetical protein
MTTTSITSTSGTVEVFTLRQVRDPLDEANGWAVLDPYVEIVFGSILGPTSIQMARLLTRLHRPEGQTRVRVADIAAVLVVKPSVARHALSRLERFGLLRIVGSSLILKSHLAPFKGEAVERLPMMARSYHEIAVRNRLTHASL